MFESYNAFWSKLMGKMMPSQKRRQRKSKAPEYLADFETSVNSKHSKIKKDRTKPSTSSVPNSLLTLSMFSGINKEVILTAREKGIQTRKTRRLMSGLGIDNMLASDYVSSSLDRTDLVTVKPVNLLQAFEGRGLFATQDIKEETFIGVYTGEVFDSVAVFDNYIAEHPGADDSYAMIVTGRVVDAARKGNFTRYINFSDTQANMEFVEGFIQRRKVVLVRALRDIKAGEQFLVNYNTHEERNSKAYFFLNPSDGWLSAEELHQHHKDSYSPFTIHVDLEGLGVASEDDYLLTQTGATIIDDKLLSNVIGLNLAEIDLPQLKLNEDNQVLDFNTADVFTPLQLACYLGQADNVDFLIAHGANKDYHQNNSGQYPLSLALAGYATFPGNENAYMDILINLVLNQANIFAHDRMDRTFVHQAISILPVDQFKTLLNTIQNNRGDIEDIFDYVDENDHDVVHYAIKCKALDILGLLLQLKPDYFATLAAESKNIDAKAFENALEGYTSKEKQSLYKVLVQSKQRIPERVMDELDVPRAMGLKYNR